MYKEPLVQSMCKRETNNKGMSISNWKFFNYILLF